MSALLEISEMDFVEDNVKLTNGASWMYDSFWKSFIELCHFMISIMLFIFSRFSLISMLVLLLKYVPTGFYMYKLVKSAYMASRERMSDIKMQLEDVKLQIEIVRTKLSVRDAENTERGQLLKRSTERLRAVRMRVREVIAADDTLRRALYTCMPWGDDPDLNKHANPEEEREFIISLLKEFKADQVAIHDFDKMDCGEHAQADPSTSANSVYSSLNDVDDQQDCRVKIVKVTNVYKVAYLKQFIKQKKLRRATRQALLKKKIEGIKKMLEDWQKALNMAINSKISMLNASPLDIASQEAMGDFSKPNLRDTDSDSDMKTSITDSCYEEYSLSWAQNPYRNFTYGFDDNTESMMKDFETQGVSSYPCDCNATKANVLFILPEETSSQVAIDEIKAESRPEFETECRDIVAL